MRSHISMCKSSACRTRPLRTVAGWTIRVCWRTRRSSCRKKQAHERTCSRTLRSTPCTASSCGRRTCRSRQWTSRSATRRTASTRTSTPTTATSPGNQPNRTGTHTHIGTRLRFSATHVGHVTTTHVMGSWKDTSWHALITYLRFTIADQRGQLTWTPCYLYTRVRTNTSTL